MRLTVRQGLWTGGPDVDPPPLAAVLEVSGAVLEWTVDEPDSLPRITLTDLDAADWLWRLVGAEGHARLLEADSTTPLEVDLDHEALAPLRRLALGHWMSRWWPASARDGIVALDGAVLGAELAVLTAALEEYFAEDTFDSDVDGLLAGLAGLTSYTADPRVADLLDACAELGDLPDIGTTPTRWRADFALVAGGDPRLDPSAALASGTDSVSWTAVPPGVFDAAEDTVTWSVAMTGPAGEGLVARVRAALTDPAAGHPLSAGIRVALRSGDVAAAGELGADGDATLPLALTESAAWNHDWAATSIRVGVGEGETRETRDRVRRFVRTRLAAPPADAFVAEMLAADDDF
ncbi:hypothetical protein KVF89_23410 [Nocardioides carbamazepini]|uniref:hypothetical protein n=1 Tax=Nocardioides carbamazepini TaxID=2854259 RepID=UPI00214A03E9|nr:hypothetical protein [Nocardioides carbamazepini]MCR1785506.1 hypothetical protein [Nocardioides carbamazepini]